MMYIHNTRQTACVCGEYFIVLLGNNFLSCSGKITVFTLICSCRAFQAHGKQCTGFETLLHNSVSLFRGEPEKNGTLTKTVDHEEKAKGGC